MDKEETTRLVETDSSPEPQNVRAVAPKEKPTEGEPASTKFVRDVVFYLVIILFIGFAATFVAAAAMLVDSWRSDKASNEELIKEISASNAKIDILTNEINQQRGISTPTR